MSGSFARVMLATLILLQGILAVGRGQHAVVLRECVDHALLSLATHAHDSHSHGPGEHHHEHRQILLHSHGDPSCASELLESPAMTATSEPCSDHCDHAACACLHLHLDSGAAVVESSRVAIEFARPVDDESSSYPIESPRHGSRHTELRFVGDHPPDRVLLESLASIVLRF